MPISDEARYRLKLAEGFLDESRQDAASRHWRACVDDSQLATENAAKAALAVIGPVGRTHDPAPLLRDALADGLFPPGSEQAVRRLAECAGLLGPAVHIQSDYGDEATGRTPWELFDQVAAEHAGDLAEEAVKLARDILGVSTPSA